MNNQTNKYSLPYYPNVSVGWDVSPRTDQEDIYEQLEYPYTSILVDNTPGEFEKVLMQAKEFLDKGHTQAPILVINSWNEWTEGSYLEPDSVYGMGHLEALKKVFSK